MIHNDIHQALRERVLTLDGAMGTMLQKARAEAGCIDLLCLSSPDTIEDIHLQYLQAGADIITTDTFNANALSLSRYGASHLVKDICREAVAAARRAIRRIGRQAWIAGDVGPTGKSLSMTSDDTDVDFDTLRAAYLEQIDAIARAGADLILLETIFDTLNAKAAISALLEVRESTGLELPLMVSATLTESGRLLSGQTLEAFIVSISHARPLSVGLNCGFGAEQAIEFLPQLQHATCAVSLHPNAGLPDAMGCYTSTPSDMTAALRRPLADGMLNIVGGCCGTTPAHIRAIAAEAAAARPRNIPDCDPAAPLQLAGLEALTVAPDRLTPVGERCNVAGSRKFLRLIKEGNLNEAIAIAAAQTDAGARIIDINMDDALLDAAREMQRFVRLASAEPDVARVPFMIDSSQWEVVESTLKLVQGKPVVNSISLKEGEEEMIRRARHISSMGAAMVVMAFDERGQADTFERKTEVCARAYRLLTDAGIAPSDIIFDPNILAVATGIEHHARYGLDFIRAARWIRQNLPGAGVSGGLSNLSFSFRGNNFVREAIHAIFLANAAGSDGMNMAIVNPSTLIDTATIPEPLAEAITDTLLCRRADADERLIAVAASTDAPGRKASPATQPEAPDTVSTPCSRLADAVVKGRADALPTLLQEAQAEAGSAFALVEGPLMQGMDRVGHLFGEGRMFLPQVVKSARLMQQAVELLTPAIEAEKAAAPGNAGRRNPRMVIATVRGDVHDIGKNIVAVVMRCNGFDVTDLGVMVEGERIVSEAQRLEADLVGLSGLITPSLAEMAEVARLMQQAGMSTPLLVGGAAASVLHTALRIAPCYSGPTFYTHDAASLPTLAAKLIDPRQADETISRNAVDQARRREEYTAPQHPATETVPDAPAAPATPAPTPAREGLHTLHPSVEELRPLINWRAFLAAWRTSACTDEARDVTDDANRVIDLLQQRGATLTARILLCHARSQGLDINVTSADGSITIPTLRKAEPSEIDGLRPAIADFIAPEGDWIGLFVVTTAGDIAAYTDEMRLQGDPYAAITAQLVADRLAEAAAEWLHRLTATEIWGFSTDTSAIGIRPAVGYPSLPDQSIIHLLDRLIHYDEIGVTVTENGAMSPSATVSGLIIAAPGARYFTIGHLTDEARADYARRRGLTPHALARFLPR